MYHVICRGDRREKIFLDDVDRHNLIKTLAEACQKTGWRVHAYCLMPNRQNRRWQWDRLSAHRVRLCAPESRVLYLRSSASSADKSMNPTGKSTDGADDTHGKPQHNGLALGRQRRQTQGCTST
ncbi:MAG TPA: hypothetical protein VN673_05795 [Clostridia bacterium]|nr:hypothetical protein [Clostridia bacterium]